MNVPTDRVSMTLLVAIGTLGLLGFLLAFVVPSSGGEPPTLVLVVGILAAAAVIGGVWFGLERIE